ncbi:MAG: phosphatidate cytidylyltransferase [Luteolibacter sp.]
METETPSYGRAGRDLIAAIGVGLVLGIGLVLAPLLWAPWVFALVVAAAMVVGALEIEAAYAHREVILVRWPLLAGTVGIPLCAYCLGPGAMVAAFAAALLPIWAVRLAGPTEGYVADIGACSFVLAYTGLLGGFATLTLAAPNGAARTLSFVLLTICSDIGGYAAGALLRPAPDRARGFPEEVLGGTGRFARPAVGGRCAAVRLPAARAPWWQGLVAGLVITVDGDRSATSSERPSSATSASRTWAPFLPGHGGLMDRLDSCCPNAFVSWALFTRFLGP